MLILAEMNSELSCVLMVFVFLGAAVTAFRARLMAVRVGALVCIVTAYFGVMESSFPTLFIALIGAIILSAIDELVRLIDDRTKSIMASMEASVKMSEQRLAAKDKAK